MLTPTRIIKFKREHPLAVLPTRDPGNAGYDLDIPEETILHPWKPTLVNLGFSTEFPCDLWANIRSRSSSMPKKRIMVIHGIIDSSYRGPWKLSLMYIPEMDTEWSPKMMADYGRWSEEPLVLAPGSRVAQVVFEHIPETFWEESEEDLTKSARGERGFGESTGL